jgi:hypothetical protein
MQTTQQAVQAVRSITVTADQNGHVMKEETKTELNAALAVIEKNASLIDLEKK